MSDSPADLQPSGSGQREDGGREATAPDTSPPPPLAGAGLARSPVRLLLRWARWLVPIAAVAWLLTSGGIDFSGLNIPGGRRHYLVLGAAIWLCTMLLSYVRHRTILRAMGVPITLRQAVHVGWIGSFYNMVLFGGVGGDLVKVGYLLKITGGQRRAAILSSLPVDRALGALALFVIGGGAVLLSWDEFAAEPRLHAVVVGTFAALGVVGLGGVATLATLARTRVTGLIAWSVGLLLLAAPLLLEWSDASGELARQLLRSLWMTLAIVAAVALLGVAVAPLLLPGRPLAETVRNRLPLGRAVMAVVDSVLALRERVGSLTVAFALALVLQTGCVAGIYCFAQAVPIEPHPTVGHVLFAVPASMVANALPLPGGGLGVGETTLEVLLRLCKVDGEPVTSGAETFLLTRIVLTTLSLLGLPLSFLRVTPRRP